MSKAVFSLWHREIVRFVRDRSRLTGSLMQPIIFWLLFSGALNTSVQFGGMESYSEYFFSGTLAMITLFTAIFSTITVIEDRKEGFLQGVLVSPVPRAAIALGKILGGATLGCRRRVGRARSTRGDSAASLGGRNRGSGARGRLPSRALGAKSSARCYVGSPSLKTWDV